MGEFSNRVVVVTGGASGIGKGVAEAFALEGAKVFFADVNEDLGLKTYYNIMMACPGEEVVFKKADLSKSEEAMSFINHILDAAGYVDILVNNAGVNLKAGSILEHEIEDFKNTYNLNVYGYIYCIKGFLPSMIERKKGVIINISSTMASGAKNYSAYASSKGCIEVLTKSLALDHACDNVRINAVAPGIIDTPATHDWILEQEDAAAVKGVPMGKVGLAKDVANAVLFLSSDRASYITGHTLVVDGGLTIGE